MSPRKVNAMSATEAKNIRVAFSMMALDAVNLGFDDAVDMAAPRNAARVLQLVEGFGHRRPLGWRLQHTKKLRQIYGAAFDCGAMAKRLLP